MDNQSVESDEIVRQVRTYVNGWLNGDENALPPEAFNVLEDIRALVVPPEGGAS